MNGSSEVILRNLAHLRPGGLTLINPPADSLFRQLMASHDPVDILTNHHGDFRWFSDSGAIVSFNPLPGRGKPESTYVLFLPREKGLLLMLLHALAAAIPGEGNLWLVGENKAGIKSARRHLEAFYDRVNKLDSARHCGLYAASTPRAVEAFDLASYLETWSVDFGDTRLNVGSLPGVFAHGRLDKGSRLLLDSMGKPDPGANVLDFACGSGVIGCALLKAQSDMRLTFSDVSFLAIESCRHTLGMNDLSATLLPSDGLAEVVGTYDLIVSNPPFHRGIRNDLDIAAKFFHDAGTFLTENGRIVIVCNRHLPYESWLRKYFNQVNQLGANREFMVLEAAQPNNHR
jgi:16S rRNA (guanine1207-N2)-methyltransferase